MDFIDDIFGDKKKSSKDVVLEQNDHAGNAMKKADAEKKLKADQ